MSFCDGKVDWPLPAGFAGAEGVCEEGGVGGGDYGEEVAHFSFFFLGGGFGLVLAVVEGMRCIEVWIEVEMGWGLG